MGLGKFFWSERGIVSSTCRDGLDVVEKIDLDPNRYDSLYANYIASILFGNAKIVCKVKI